MNKNSLFIAIVSSFLLIPSSNAASTDELSSNLMIEQSIVNSEVIKFKNDEKLYPEASDFKIIHSVTMSNERGERWATLTISNQATGRRILKNHHIMAVFANGKRRFPIIDENTFESNETLSLSVYFGKSKFPILKLLTRE
ncbi:hypothetical protein [Pleionea sediminis]|uniref:hypothetical protein n=1 Tax=Pleionea sediminis TaxID=2569479 RepID=UPI001184BAD8|nr:hypothetical protein [Pleionea sediminis]